MIASEKDVEKAMISSISPSWIQILDPEDYSPIDFEMNDKFKNVPDVSEAMKNPGKVPYLDRNKKVKYGTAPKAPMPKGNFVEINKMLGR